MMVLIDSPGEGGIKQLGGEKGESRGEKQVVRPFMQRLIFGRVIVTSQDLALWTLW